MADYAPGIKADAPMSLALQTTISDLAIGKQILVPGNVAVTVTVTWATSATKALPYRCQVTDDQVGQIFEFSGVCDSDGIFTVNAPIQNTSKAYVWVKGPHYLGVVGHGTIADNAVSIAVTAIGGDCNDDNRCDGPDFVILRDTYTYGLGDAGYDARADFNYDDIVDVSDYNIFLAGFGQQGVAPFMQPAVLVATANIPGLVALSGTPADSKTPIVGVVEATGLLTASVVPPTSVFTQHTGAALASSTTTTSLLDGAGVTTGSKTIAANRMAVGDTVRLDMWGLISLAAATDTGTLTLVVSVGTEVLATNDYTGGATTDTGWHLHFVFTCRTAGASGRVWGQGSFDYEDIASQILNPVPLKMTAQSGVIDLTAAQAIAVTGKWDKSHANNSITCTNVTIEYLSLT